ncbi:MAG: sodium:solute symporter [Candidatus Hydrogenedentes bacterium]|nr:sodium:solute symporter [Candidatus Hydrogenedentota bacterium]
MSHFGALDWTIVIVYFVAMASVGPYFARRNKSTDGYFVGNRSFPAWLLGLAMFATSISSITVVAFPADAYKTAYLRLLPAFMLPVGILITSLTILPMFRRSRCTSAFEYLEGRFGPGIRLYAAIAFLVTQVARISTILYLVSLVFQQMTGADPYVCIFAGGIVIAIYTVSGGIRAIVTAQFVQAFLLWGGAILCFIMIVRGIDGGISTIISTALADHKFMLGDLNAATNTIEKAKWFSLREQAILMMFVMGLNNWLTEYSSNQNTIQKYVAAKNPREATLSIWICCLCSVPTWAFFMFLGTSLYVFYQVNPDPAAAAILTGEGGAKAESILPYFCVSRLPSGILGLVITGVLAAAMSASSSSVNAISAVTITDIYRRHLVKNGDEKHYVLAARIVTAFSCLIMMGGAILFNQMSKLTLQHTGTKLAALLWGGILGIYLLGFFTTRGNGKSVLAGIVCTLIFTGYITAIELEIVTKLKLMAVFGLSENWADLLSKPIHTYYTGVFGNILLFLVAYGVASLFQQRTRDLTNLTIWTRKPVEGEAE